MERFDARSALRVVAVVLGMVVLLNLMVMEPLRPAPAFRFLARRSRRISSEEELIDRRELALQRRDAVFYPSNNDTVYSDVPITITYSGIFDDPISMYLYRDGGKPGFSDDTFIQTITASSPNNGSFPWTPPSVVPGSGYYIFFGGVNQPGTIEWIIIEHSNDTSTTQSATQTQNTTLQTQYTNQTPIPTQTAAGNQTASSIVPGAVATGTNKAASATPAGTIIGGAVGACAGLLIVVGIALYFIGRNQGWWKRRSETATNADGVNGAALPTSQPSGENFLGKPAFLEMDAQSSDNLPASELPGGRPAELPGARPAELPARSPLLPSEMR